MDSSRDSEFDARLARIEAAIVVLQRSIASLLAEGRPAPSRVRAAEPSRGIGFVILAVLLLYGYAIDHGWITPSIRVLTGVIVCGLLFWAATRVPAQTEPVVESDPGLREVLFGGGLVPADCHARGQTCFLPARDRLNFGEDYGTAW